jgi:hypothetical protein
MTLGLEWLFWLVILGILLYTLVQIHMIYIGVFMGSRTHLRLIMVFFILYDMFFCLS